MPKHDDRTIPPPGYTVQEGGYERVQGWFFIPSNVPNRFYKTEAAAIKAAWKQWDADCAKGWKS